MTSILPTYVRFPEVASHAAIPTPAVGTIAIYYLDDGGSNNGLYLKFEDDSTIDLGVQANPPDGDITFDSTLTLTTSSYGAVGLYAALQYLDLRSSNAFPTGNFTFAAPYGLAASSYSAASLYAALNYLDQRAADAVSTGNITFAASYALTPSSYSAPSLYAALNYLDARSAGNLNFGVGGQNFTGGFGTYNAANLYAILNYLGSRVT